MLIVNQKYPLCPGQRRDRPALSRHYLPQGPACNTRSSRPSRQAARRSSHSLSCVRASEPHTGRSTGSQGGGQAHTATPAPSTRHSAPCRHSTSAQGFTPGIKINVGTKKYIYWYIVGGSLATYHYPTDYYPGTG